MNMQNPAEQRLKKIIEAQTLLASSEFNVHRFMNVVVDCMQELTPATGAVVELLEGDEMVYKAASGTVADHVGFRLKSNTSLSGLCVDTRELKISGDTSSDPRVDAAACAKIGAASMVCVPLFRADEAVGVLKVLSTQKDAFAEHDLETLHLMAGLLGAALGQQLEIERRQHLEDRLRHAAEHDELTQLPNRDLFYDRLSHAVARCTRQKGLLALLYMDIDHFKKINNSMGHNVGDALLRSFSERIKGITRASDTFARLGGDEFTLIAEDLNYCHEAELIAKKIVDAARQKFEFDGITLQVTSSVGIAFCVGEPIDIDHLIKIADEALYDAKRAGRNCYRMSAPVQQL